MVIAQAAARSKWIAETRMYRCGRMMSGRVSVRGQDPGVPRADQWRMWECCYRVEETRVLSGMSVGLGLGL